MGCSATGLPLREPQASACPGPLSDLGEFFAKADANSASGAIDSLQFVRRQKIYVFHGYNDAVVTKPVTDAAVEFYRHYLGEAGSLYYQNTIGAGHSLVVAQDPPLNNLNACEKSDTPFIDQCGYDQAGVILQHIYGALNDRKRGR
jgi:poly(3-hydroxybutyrate) depolymerase